MYRSLIAACLAGLLAAAPAPTAAASWTGPTDVDTAAATDAVVDGNGKLHVVTGSYDAGIRYITNRSGSWHSEDVTQFHGDIDASIAVAHGKVYVAFVRVIDCGACAPRLSTGIRFATNRSGTWKVKRLTSGVDVAPSIQVRNGRAHIAYNDGKGVRYLSESASGTWSNVRVWKRTAGLGTVMSQANVSLALDGRGHAHVAFDRTREDASVRGGVSYATNRSGTWTTTSLHSGYDTVDRILFDSTGRLHIGYTEWQPAPVRYRILRRSGSSWVSTTPPGSGWGSFSLDGHDRYEVARTTSAALTWYAHRTSGWLSKSWTIGDLQEPLARTSDDGTSYLVYSVGTGPAASFVRVRH